MENIARAKEIPQRRSNSSGADLEHAVRLGQDRRKQKMHRFHPSDKLDFIRFDKIEKVSC